MGRALLRVVAVLTALSALGCTRPPEAAGSGTTATGLPPPPADCATPPVANEPEGCRDDEARPPGAPPVDRPGVDRDDDGLEDLLDACPAEPEDADGDRDEDGCPDDVESPAGPAILAPTA